MLLQVDNTTGRNSKTYLRTRPKDLTQCGSCHHGPGQPPGPVGERAMFKGIDMTGVLAPDPAMDWEFVDQLRKFWRGKLIIKGIDTHEDACRSRDRNPAGRTETRHGQLRHANGCRHQPVRHSDPRLED